MFKNLFRIRNHYSKVIVQQIIIYSLLAFVVFIIPYLLWVLNLIPDYNFSIVLGLIFSFVVLGFWGCGWVFCMQVLIIHLRLDS